MTAEAIITAAKNAAAKTGGILSRADFIRLTGISEHHIYATFPTGGWSEVKRLAGLQRHPHHREPVSDDDLLREFHRVVTSVGIPTWAVFSSQANVSADVVRRRFGGLQGTLKRYRTWLESHEPQSPLLSALRASSDHEIPPPPAPMTSAGRPVNWPKSETTEFGQPINFRGLRHAPINEQGVVFLFGMVSYELGFIVEAVHAAYPDCEAKRCVDRRRDRWQRVRIEFEFRSRHFLEGGHDPKHCDVIVCWEHNWPECPLEIIELRRVINDLDP